MEIEINLKQIIASMFNMANPPMNETLFNLNIKEQHQLQRLNDKLHKHYGKPVGVQTSDTIYTISERIKKSA